MALFGTKKNTEKVEKQIAKAVTKAVIAREKTEGEPTLVIAKDVILRPRITEKSGMMNEALNVYTFEVVKNSTKHSVSKAVNALYKVKPLKVRIVNLPAKDVFVKGKHGTKPAVKKALVFLKKGDKIEFA